MSSDNALDCTDNISISVFGVSSILVGKVAGKFVLKVSYML